MIGIRSQSKKIGLFGGTFDPVHIGHATLAMCVYTDFKLDELIFIPSQIPPHKDITHATPQERFSMAKLTAEYLGAGFSVSDFEILSDRVSYSYDTVKHWREANPESELYFITGSDIFATIESWGRWDELFLYTNFIVVDRADMPFDRLLDKIPQSLLERVVKFDDFHGALAGQIVLYTMPPVDVSSTAVREHNGDKSVFLLQSVHDYIMKNELYRKLEEGERSIEEGDVMEGFESLNMIRKKHGL